MGYLDPAALRALADSCPSREYGDYLSSLLSQEVRR
jgi:hypothetical protein